MWNIQVYTCLINCQWFLYCYILVKIFKYVTVYIYILSFAEQYLPQKYFLIELEIETSKLRKERDILCGKQELDSLQDEKILHMRELDKALRFSKAENDELHRVNNVFEISLLFF